MACSRWGRSQRGACRGYACNPATLGVFDQMRATARPGTLEARVTTAR